MGAIVRVMRRAARWVSPPVPAHIRSALQQAQFHSVRRQVPMLLSVAALNTIIIMAVCANDGLPTSHYAWMSLIVLYCAVRIAMWIRRIGRPLEPSGIPRLLKLNLAASLTMVTALGVATTWTFVAGTFGSKLLIPMSLGFGATSIAHCLYTLRPAAIGTVVMGLFPSSLAMIFLGAFDAQMLGVAMISVGMLMIRFVAEQYDQLIQSLLLQDENQRLALSDPLTGIANRRAIMAALDAEATAGTSFGVALLDLDGFKQVNDGLGHHAGDLMLQRVSERLVSAALPGDSVGRLGGDEFILLLRGVEGETDMSARTTAMLAALCRPVEIEGHVVSVAASLGYALTANAADSVDLLLRRADKALYTAKRQRRVAANAPAAPVRRFRQAESA